MGIVFYVDSKWFTARNSATVSKISVKVEPNRTENERQLYLNNKTFFSTSHTHIEAKKHKSINVFYRPKQNINTVSNKLHMIKHFVYVYICCWMNIWLNFKCFLSISIYDFVRFTSSCKFYRTGLANTTTAGYKTRLI